MTETPVDNPIKTFMCAVGSVIGFSLMNVFVKITSDHVSIAQLIFFRNFLAFIPIMFMIMQHKRKLNLLKSGDHMGHFWRCSAGISGMLFFFISFHMLPLTNATALHFVMPLMVTLFSILFLKERVGLPRWGAIIIGFSAILFMLHPSDAGNLLGSLAALTGALLGAVAMMFIRKIGQTEHPLTIVFYFTLFGSLTGGAAMIFMWEPLSAIILMYLLLIGLLGGGAQISLTYAYAHAPTAYVAPFYYMTIIFSVISDIMIWGKWPDWHIWIGSIAIIASGLFIVYRETKKKQSNQT
jgi:drug/metabolite transporter (DMT)-like permease